MSKIIVVYYSFEGSTKRVAEYLAQHLDADLMEVKPESELKSKGFSKFIWGGYQVFMGKKPELTPLTRDLNEYDTVFVGTPIWAGTYAPPIKSLLEGDFIKGKQVAYFYCHEGGHRKAVEKAKRVIEIHNEFIGAKDILNPKRDMESCLKDVRNWLELFRKNK
ncbi:flavodoxin [Mycoplasmatota bacterium WC44]